MNLKRLKSIYASVPLMIAAALIAGFGLIYYLHVSAKRDYLRDRNLRQLLLIGNQLNQRIADLAAVLSKTPGSKGRDAGVLKPEDYLRPAGFADTRHGRSPREFGIAPRVGERDTNLWSQTCLVRSNDKVMVQLVSVDRARDDEWVTVVATLDLRELIEASLAWSVFDDILLASHDGEVAYQHSSAGAQVRRMDSLLDPRGTPIEFSRRASTAGVADLVLAGSEYKFFCQPITLPPDRTDSSARAEGWVMCGLVAMDRFNKEANELPIPLVMIVVLLLIFVSLSWPFLKLWSLSASERPSRLDILFAVMALLFGTALGTCVVLDLLSIYVVVEPDLDRHLSALSDSIEQTFHAELSDAVKQLDASSAIRSQDLAGRGEESQMNRANILDTSRTSTHFPRIYRNADVFYWVNTYGKQVGKWSIDAGITPLINVRARNYFRDVKEKRYLRLGSNGHLFAVEPHYSWTTGRFQLAISVMDSVSKPGEKRVAVMDTRPLSLVQPVLVPGYAFCVIDEKGNVLFHSIENRNLRENLFSEMQPDRSLKAAVSARSAAHLDVSYWGLDQRMYVRPMRALPWFLVVFREKTSLWTLNLEGLTGAIVLFALSLVGPTAVFFWLCRKTRWTAYWAWPAFKRPDVYQKLLLVYLIHLAVFLALVVFVGWRDKNLVTAFLSIVALGSLLVYLTGNCLDEKRHQRLSGWKPQFRNLTWIGGLGLLISAGATLQREKPIPLVGDLAPILCLELFLFGASVLYLVASREHKASEIVTGLRFNRVYALCALCLSLLISAYPAFVFFHLSYDVQARLLVKHAQQELGQALHGRDTRVRAKYGSLPESVLSGFLRDSTGIYTTFFFHSTKEAVPEPDTCFKAARESSQWGGQKPWLYYKLMAPYNATSTVMRELLGDVTIDSAFAWVALPQGRLMFHGEDLRSGKVVHLATTVPTLLYWVDLSHARSNARLLIWIGVFSVFAFLLYLLLRTALRRLYLIDENVGRRPSAPQPGQKGHSGNILLLSALPRGDIRWLNTDAFHIIDIATMPWKRMPKTRASVGSLPSTKTVLVDHLEFDMENVETNVHKVELLEEIIHVYRRRVMLLSGADPLSSFALRRERKEKSEASPEDYAPRWKAVLSGCTRIHCDRDDDLEATTTLPKVILDECRHSAELRRIGDEVYRSGQAQGESSVVRGVLDRARPYYRRLWMLCTLEERRVLLDAAAGDYVSYSNLSVVRDLEERGLLRRCPNVKPMNESFGMFLRSAGLEEEVRPKEGEAELTDWKRMRVAFHTLLVAVVLFLFLTQREIISSAMAFISVASALLPGVFKLVGLITAKKEQSGGGA